MDDKQVTQRILGLPMERVEYLHTECGMPYDDEGFTAWFVANAVMVLTEKRAHLDSVLFPGKLRPEPAKPPLA